MNNNYDKVKQFMQTFGQNVSNTPSWPSLEVQQLRYDLIAEELREFKEAMDNEDLVEVADALTDLLYVVYGAGASFGIDINKCFEEVHRSNMSKLGPDGKPIYREDGKVIKGPSYSPPNLRDVMFWERN